MTNGSSYPMESLKQDTDEPPSWWRRAWHAAWIRWRGSEEAEALREAVEELIEETTSEAGAQGTERMLLNNILTLRDRHVSDCMVPRADIVAMEVGSSLDDLIAIMTEHTHSRIPLYRDTLDDAVGMIHIKDVMACVAAHKTCDLRELLRPLLFVAPSMKASKLLLQMRQKRQHMAMVVDEFGGIDGLVTMEDLVEEIVGEIDDEHDEPAQPDVIARSDGTLLIDARMPIEDFEARVGPRLSESERETIDTVGGYVFHLAGHVPLIGETVPGPQGLLFDVLETDQTRIKRVRMRTKLTDTSHEDEKKASF